jgi:hypothetical protein
LVKVVKILTEGIAMNSDERDHARGLCSSILAWLFACLPGGGRLECMRGRQLLTIN